MQFNAFERNKQGTGASRRLRNSGRAPGIVYGGTTAPTLIEIQVSYISTTLAMIHTF